eukprot:gb/GECH01013814.1/.p1 GENE.gb/GECH01013814.1/~~gb/GECH01013814.1/.p1  ORF type:complete len:1568 (+),score=248.56 gb/GECH01013814.1/:1-4704(+)
MLEKRKTPERLLEESKKALEPVPLIREALTILKAKTISFSSTTISFLNSSSFTFVICAEAALREQLYGIAQEAIEYYFAYEKLDNIQKCRALICRVTLMSHKLPNCVGQELQNRINFCVKDLEAGLRIAKEKSAIYFIHHVALVYFNTVRVIMREDNRSHLISSMKTFVDSLEEIQDGDLKLRINLHVQLALGYAESGKVDEAIKQIEKGCSLCNDNKPKQMQLQCIATSIKKGNYKPKSDSTLSKAILNFQNFKQSIRNSKSSEGSQKKVEEIFNSLMDAKKEEPNTAFRYIGELGLECVNLELDSLAEKCADAAALGAESGITFAELVRAMLSNNTEKIRKAEKIVINVTHGNTSGDMVERACMILWNAILPKIPVRECNDSKMLVRTLETITNSLDHIDSQMTRFRAMVHVELSKLLMNSQYVSKARNHVRKALSQDIPMNTQKNIHLRQRAKYLLNVLDLKSSIYRVPESSLEESVMLVDSAKQSKSVVTRREQLNRAVSMLSEENNSGETIQRAYVWVDVLRASWYSLKPSERILDIAVKSANFLLNEYKWESDHPYELLGEVNYAHLVKSDALFQKRKKKQKMELNETQDKKLTEELCNCIINFLVSSHDLNHEYLKQSIIIDACGKLCQYCISYWEKGEFLLSSKSIEECFHSLKKIIHTPIDILGCIYFAKAMILVQSNIQSQSNVDNISIIAKETKTIEWISKYSHKGKSEQVLKEAQQICEDGISHFSQKEVDSLWVKKLIELRLEIRQAMSLQLNIGNLSNFNCKIFSLCHQIKILAQFSDKQLESSLNDIRNEMKNGQTSNRALAYILSSTYSVGLHEMVVKLYQELNISQVFSSKWMAISEFTYAQSIYALRSTFPSSSHSSMEQRSLEITLRALEKAQKSKLPSLTLKTCTFILIILENHTLPFSVLSDIPRYIKKIQVLDNQQSNTLLNIYTEIVDRLLIVNRSRRASKVIKKAIQQLPRSFHKKLWMKDIQVKCQQNDLEGLERSLRRIQEYDIRTKALSWERALFSTGDYRFLDKFLEIVQGLDHFMRCTYFIQIGYWLKLNYNSKDLINMIFKQIEDILKESNSSLKVGQQYNLRIQFYILKARISNDREQYKEDMLNGYNIIINWIRNTFDETKSYESLVFQKLNHSTGHVHSNSCICAPESIYYVSNFLHLLWDMEEHFQELGRTIHSLVILNIILFYSKSQNQIHSRILASLQIQEMKHDFNIDLDHYSDDFTTDDLKFASGKVNRSNTTIYYRPRIDNQFVMKLNDTTSLKYRCQTRIGMKLLKMKRNYEASYFIHIPEILSQIYYQSGDFDKAFNEEKNIREQYSFISCSGIRQHVERLLLIVHCLPNNTKDNFTRTITNDALQGIDYNIQMTNSHQAKIESAKLKHFVATHFLDDKERVDPLESAKSIIFECEKSDTYYGIRILLDAAHQYKEINDLYYCKQLVESAVSAAENAFNVSVAPFNSNFPNSDLYKLIELPELVLLSQSLLDLANIELKLNRSSFKEEKNSCTNGLHQVVDDSTFIGNLKSSKNRPVLLLSSVLSIGIPSHVNSAWNSLENIDDES